MPLSPDEEFAADYSLFIHRPIKYKAAWAMMIIKNTKRSSTDSVTRNTAQIPP